VRQLLPTLRGTIEEWQRLRWSELQFAEARTALIVLVVLLAIAALMLVVRGLVRTQAGRSHVALPAVVRTVTRSHVSAVRLAPFLLFLCGLPFFAVALADPRTTFKREDLSHPGRRIAILIDASSSMTLKFKNSTLKTADSRAYYTAVAAAEHFMRLRMNGSYHDLLSLIEFGNQSYVLTPFTTDYENILLSIRLISNPREWGRFQDYGTTIIEGVEQATQLFRSFDFLNASGNSMVIFSDGLDEQVTVRGKPLQELVIQARKLEIPIYMVRTVYDFKLGALPTDRIWKAAVEQTGGRFYAAASEADILAAIKDIDSRSAGRIEVREYSTARPRFAGYALVAVALWTLAAAMKLGVRTFTAFP
jgi:hypothetical protein